VRGPEESFELAYSLPAKASILATVPIMAGLGAFAIWFAVTKWSLNIVLAFIFGAIGVWLLYVSYLSVRVSRFLNARVVVSDAGLEVERGGDTRTLPWSEIGRVRHDGIDHVLSVRDRSGELFFIVDARISGFAGLKAVLTKRGRSYAT
jgi:PH (Pleckstrin Homology) domain-containing protein